MKNFQKAAIAIVLSTFVLGSLGCKDPDTAHSEQLGQAMANQGAAMKSGSVPGPKTGAPAGAPADPSAHTK